MSSTPTESEFDKELHELVREYRRNIAAIMVKFIGYRPRLLGKRLLDDAIDAADLKHAEAIKALYGGDKK